MSSVCLTREDLTWFAQGNENFGRRVQLSDFQIKCECFIRALLTIVFTFLGPSKRQKWNSHTNVKFSPLLWKQFIWNPSVCISNELEFE